MTMSQHRRRLTHRFLSVPNVLRFNLLDNSRQLLEGKLAGGHAAFAVPDTGAEGDVMNLEYARKVGFHIKSRLENPPKPAIRRWKRTAEYWPGGLDLGFWFRVPCAPDTVLGEEAFWDNDIFENEASSPLYFSLDVDF
ncbi:hypothetical protein ABVK25_002916 [Lepraria finkii]|uniref:Uncharacterized protein n=1 Tax=Lepraria finkii TaxID=1340010 RepID=A0ABR4BGG0_9LECA